MEFILGSPAEGQAPDAAQPKSGGMEFLLGSPAASSPVPAKVPEAGSRPIRAPVQRLPQEAPELSLEETVKGAASQLVPSTVKMGRDIYQAVTSPVETGKVICQQELLAALLAAVTTLIQLAARRRVPPAASAAARSHRTGR